MIELRYKCWSLQCAFEVRKKTKLSDQNKPETEIIVIFVSFIHVFPRHFVNRTEFDWILSYSVWSLKSLFLTIG